MLQKYYTALVAMVLTLLCSIAPAVAEPVKLVSLSDDLVQGGVVFGRLQQPAKVWVDGRAVDVDAQLRFVFGLDRDAPETLTITTQLQGQEQQQWHYEVATRHYNLQKITGIKRSIMQPSAADIKRIKADVREAKAARKQDLALDAWQQRFIWPITGRITGVFGSQRVYNGVPSRPHYGVDIAAPTGSAVVAPAGGVITLANPDMFYSGGTVFIDHGRGLSSAFLHLSKLDVSVGEKVTQGQLIGEVGASGRSTGPHLDWRMNWFDRRVDPQLLVPPMIVQ